MLMTVSAIDKVCKRYIELNLHSGYLVLCRQVIAIVTTELHIDIRTERGIQKP